MKCAATLLIIALAWGLVIGRSGADVDDSGRYFGSEIINTVFDSAENVPGDQLCVQHLRVWRQRADNFTLWALQMLDATPKFPSGILYGARHHLGNFDECLSVNNGAEGTQRITGKYCLGSLTLQPKTIIPPCVENESSCSAWEKLKPPAHRFQISRNPVQWAVCVPATCSARNLNLMFAAQQLNFRDLGVNITVREDHCQTMESRVSGGMLPFFVAVVLLYFGFLLVYYITMKEDFPGPKNFSWYQAFSVRAHWRTLTGTHLGEDSIDCINGLRVLSMVVIVVGHRIEAATAGPITNGLDFEEMYSNVIDVIFMNGTLIVEVFFTMSGFLISWKLFHILDKKKGLNLINLYMFRYLRLTPVLMVIIFFQAFVLYDLSSGPLWQTRIGFERDNCRANWWTNLLYINNYINPDRPCVDPAWYLAVDNQLFVLAPLLILCIHKWQHGYLSLVAAILTATAIPFTITYVKDLDPTFIADAASLGHSTENETYILTYITTYCRAGPYLVGMMFGYWYHCMQNAKTAIPKVVLIAGWVLGPLLSVATMSSSLLFYRPNHQLNKIVIATYAALHRTVVALGVGFVITACANGQGGVVNQVLSWARFRPLSRLVYSLFLCHTVVQMIQHGATHTQTYLSSTDIVWSSIGDLVISTGIATVLYLTVERPVQMLGVSLLPSSNPTSQ